MISKISMKREYWCKFVGCIIFLGVSIGVLLGCGNRRGESITITDFQSDTGYVDDDGYNCKAYDKNGKSVDYLIWNKAKFSDGSRMEYIEKYGPNNSLAEFVDANGRKIATWALASECYTQYLMYNYDKEGRLVNIRNCPIDERINEERDENGEYVYDQETQKLLKEWFGTQDLSNYPDSLIYLAFRNRMEQIDYSVVDTSWCSQLNLEYNRQGELVKIALIGNVSDGWLYSDDDTYHVTELLATKDVKLACDVLPVVSFWESDISGGHFYIQIDQITYNEPERRRVEKRYIDFYLVSEKHYKNDILEKNIVYDDYTIERYMVR